MKWLEIGKIYLSYLFLSVITQLVMCTDCENIQFSNVFIYTLLKLLQIKVACFWIYTTKLLLLLSLPRRTHGAVQHTTVVGNKLFLYPTVVPKFFASTIRNKDKIKTKQISKIKEFNIIMYRLRIFPLGNSLRLLLEVQDE